MLFSPGGGGGGVTSYTTAQRDALTPTNGQVIFNTTSLRTQQYDSTNAIWRDVGDPLGINYIINWNAESNVTTGWATYADAAGTSPVDGTGGSPNVTISTTASSPLYGASSFTLVKDAVNRQGQGWSYDFTIDAGQQAKVLNINIPYIVSSGTFVAGSSNTSTSDVTVWIYDKTNAVLIQPSNISLFSNSTTVSDIFKSSFQTSSNSTSYRLIIHVASTSASAYTLLMDNVSVSPSGYIFGSPITKSLAYTPTLTGFGTGTSLNFTYARAGDSILIEGTFTTGTTTATEARISLPSGLTSASDYPTLQCVGFGTDSTSDQTFLPLIEASKTYLTVGKGNSGTAGLAKANGNAYSSSITVSFKAVIRITGFDSSVQMSNDTDTRVIAAIISGDPASATSGNPIIVPTIGYDSHGAYSASTGRYTVPVSGIYKMFGSLQSASSATTLTIYKNAVSTSLCGNLDSNGEATYCGAVQCVSGDIIDVRPGGTVDATNMTLNIERLSGPAAIAATESVNARYYASATSISGSLATVVWTTKDFDSHNAMSSGLYTVPTSGKYQVNTALALAGTFALNNQSNLVIQKNSTTVSEVLDYAGGAETADHVILSDIISCVAGDVIRVQVSSGATGPSIVSSNTKNYISITRVGN